MRFLPLMTGAVAAFTATTAFAQTTTTAPTPQTTPMPMAMPTPTATPTTPSPMATDTPAATAPAPAGAAAAAPAPAPTPVQPTVGATVYGAGGTPVGTIKAMDSQYVTLATAKGEVKLPRAGVGPGLNGPVIGLTSDQLDAAVTAAQQPAATPAAPRRR